jgi:hypothetical protein
MAIKMAQTDITPSSGPIGLNLHLHTPSGVSANTFNNAADFPNSAPAAASNSQAKAVKVTVAGNVRVANPA